MDLSAIKRNDIVILTDKQTITDQMKANVSNFSKGLEATVKEVEFVKEASGACKWQIIETDKDITLIIKSAGTDSDYYLVFIPDGLPQGDRNDWIKAECQWIFHEPDDLNNYKISDLEYAKNIWDEDIEFVEKYPTLYGQMKDKFVGIHEWKADDSVENPEVFVFEIGGEDSEYGGYIRFYKGEKVSEHDIELMPV